MMALEAEPWVSAATVETVYRALQRRALGGINQRVGEKALAVFEFALERIDDDHGIPPFRQLAEE